MPITNYYWDVDTDNVVLEEDENGNTIAEYTQEPNVYGELIAQERDSQASFYNFDGQGSTRELTDQNQNVTDTYEYTAFGEEIAHTGTTQNPLRFKGAHGYYTNSDTNDVYVRARMYKPTVGRWLSLDTLEFLDGPNQYCYVHNAPVVFVDPAGNRAIGIVHEIKDRGCKNCGGFHSDVTFNITSVSGFTDGRDVQLALVQRMCIKWSEEYCSGDVSCCTMTGQKKEGFCCFNEFLGFIYVAKNAARMDSLAKQPDEWARRGVDAQCYSTGKVAYVSDLYVVPGSEELDKINKQIKQNPRVKVPCGDDTVDANPGPKTINISSSFGHSVGVVKGTWNCCPKMEKHCTTDIIAPF